jgi:hypothetical protein
MDDQKRAEDTQDDVEDLETTPEDGEAIRGGAWYQQYAGTDGEFKASGPQQGGGALGKKGPS